MDKVCAFSADNTNTNFGGVECKDKNSIYQKFTEKLGRIIIEIGCGEHILYNGIK